MYDTIKNNMKFERINPHSENKVERAKKLLGLEHAEFTLQELFDKQQSLKAIYEKGEDSSDAILKLKFAYADLERFAIDYVDEAA